MLHFIEFKFIVEYKSIIKTVNIELSQRQYSTCSRMKKYKQLLVTPWSLAILNYTYLKHKDNEKLATPSQMFLWMKNKRSSGFDTLHKQHLVKVSPLRDLWAKTDELTLESALNR